MRKLQSFLAVVLVSLVLVGCESGCASTGGVKKAGYQGTVITTQALSLVQVAEMDLYNSGVIDKPKHKQINAVLADAIRANIAAIDAWTALPEVITAPTPEVLTLVSRVWEFIERVRALIPDGKPKEALNKKLEPLTIAAGKQ